jgi:Ca-activated chloride channel family protein
MGFGSRHRTASQLLGVLLAAAGLLVVIPVGALPQAGAADEDKGTLLLLLDASGSMKEPAGSGVDKMTAAKRAAAKVVDSLPADAVVGLRLYGSTIPDGAGSCTDTKLVVPPGPLDRARLKAEIAKVKPLGNTPIAHSLQKAAGDLPREGPRSIVLVSDGEESCGGDPCSVAAALTKRGIDLHIDVIGFRVDQKARSQLACVAQAGRGTYYDAPDAGSLAVQLQRLSTRAARAYQPQGTPIRGTTVPEGAPTVEAGQYRDIIGGDTSKRHYSVDYINGSTVHASATIQPTAASLTSTEQLTISVLSAAGDVCTKQIQTGIAGFTNQTPVSTTLTFPSQTGAPSCTASGRYTLLVERGQQSAEVKPLELVLIEEPPVTSKTGLPPAVTSGYDVSSSVSGSPQLAAGSPNFTDAPELTPGVWRDTILPNETLLYRVDLDWGQQLVCDVTVAASPAFNARRLNAGVSAPVKLFGFGPSRIELYDSAFTGVDSKLYDGSKPLSLHRSSAPVRYLNRESHTANARGAALPGAYYCGVLVNAGKYVTGPTEIPLTIKVDVVGTAGAGAPTYQQVGGVSTPTAGAPAAPPPAGSEANDESGKSANSSRWWILLTIAMLLVLVIAGVVLLRRRATTQEDVGNA